MSVVECSQIQSCLIVLIRGMRTYQIHSSIIWQAQCEGGKHGRTSHWYTLCSPPFERKDKWCTFSFPTISHFFLFSFVTLQFKDLHLLNISHFIWFLMKSSFFVTAIMLSSFKLIVLHLKNQQKCSEHTFTMIHELHVLLCVFSTGPEATFETTGWVNPIVSSLNWAQS